MGDKLDFVRRLFGWRKPWESKGEIREEEEAYVSSDRGSEDYLKADETYSEGAETPTEADLSYKIRTPLESQGRSKRSLMRLVLICVGCVILVLALFFILKPERKEPHIFDQPKKYPLASIEREEEPAMPGAVEEKKREEQALKGAVVEVERPEISAKEEEKPQVAMVEEPKGRAIPEAKLPTGRYTVNVGSFRERARAERLMNVLKKKEYKAFVVEAAIPQRGTWYRVSVGRFSTREEAQVFARALKEKERIDYFVTELKEAKK